MGNDEKKLSAPDAASKEIAQESVATNFKVQHMSGYLISDAQAAEELAVNVESRALPELYMQKYYLNPDMPRPNPNTTSIQAQDFILEKIKDIASCDDGKESEGIKQRIRELSQSISEIKKAHENATQHAKVAIFIRNSAQFTDLNISIVKILQAAVRNLDLRVAEDAEVFNNIASLSIIAEQQEIQDQTINTAKELPQNTAQEIAMSNLRIPVTNALSMVIDCILKDIVTNPECLNDADKATIESLTNEQQKLAKCRELVTADLNVLFKTAYKAQDDESEINTEYRTNLVPANNASLQKPEPKHLALLEELAFTAKYQLLHPLLENNAVLEALTYADAISAPDPTDPLSKNIGINPEEFSEFGGATSYLKKFDQIVEKLSTDDQGALNLEVFADYTKLLQHIELPDPNASAPAKVPAIEELEKLVIDAMSQCMGSVSGNDNEKKVTYQFLHGISRNGVRSLATDLKDLYNNTTQHGITFPCSAAEASDKSRFAVCSVDRLLDLTTHPLPIFIETKNLSENMKNLLGQGFSKQYENMLKFSVPYANLPANLKIANNTKAILNSALQKVTDHNNAQLEKANALLQAYHNITKIKPEITVALKQQKGSSIEEQAVNGKKILGKQMVYGLEQKEKNPLLNLDSNIKKAKKPDQTVYVAANAITNVDKIFTNDTKANHLVQNLVSCKDLLESGMYTIVEKTTEAAEQEEMAKETPADTKDLITDPSKLLDMAHNEFRLLSNTNDNAEFLSFSVLQRNDQSSDTKRFVIKPAHNLSATMKELFGETFAIKQEKNGELVVTKKSKRHDAPEEQQIPSKSLTANHINKILTEQTQDDGPKINTFDLIDLLADAAYLSVSANKTLALAIAPILSKLNDFKPVQGAERTVKNAAQLAQNALHRTLKQHVKLSLDAQTKTLTCEVDLKEICGNESIVKITKDNLTKNVKTLNSILRQTKGDKGVTIKLNEDSTKLIVTQAKPPKQANAIISMDAAAVAAAAEGGNQLANFHSLNNAYKAVLYYLQGTPAEANNANATNDILAENSKVVAELYQKAHDPINKYIDAQYSDKVAKAARYAELLKAAKEATAEEKTSANENKTQESTPANILPEIKEAVKFLQVETDKEAEEAAQNMMQGAYNTIAKLPEKCSIKLKEQAADKKEEMAQPKDETTIAAEKHQRAAMQAIFAAIADAANKKMAEKEAQEATGFFAKATRLLKKSVNTTWSKFTAPIFYSIPLKVKDMLFGAPDKGTELQRAINKTCLVQSTNNVEFAITGFALLLSNQQPSGADKAQLDNKVDALLKKFENIKIDETNTNAVLAAILSGDTGNIEIVDQNGKKAVTPAKEAAVEKLQSAPSTKTDITNAVAANTNVAKQASVALAS